MTGAIVSGSMVAEPVGASRPIRYLVAALCIFLIALMLAPLVTGDRWRRSIWAIFQPFMSFPADRMKLRVAFCQMMQAGPN